MAPVMRRSIHVGINNYPGTENDLSGCVNDAHDWEDVLGKKYHFDTAHVLLNDTATKAAIMTTLGEHITLTKSGDVLVFTFSGHGSWIPDTHGDEPDGRDECLCPWDVGTTGALITDDELYALFASRAKGSRIVFVADSCHSGTVARYAAPLLGPKELPKTDTMRFLPPDHFLGFHRRVPKTVVRKAEAGTTMPRKAAQQALLLAACKDKEYSWDAEFSGRPNGAFTYAALRALKPLSTAACYEDWYHAIRKLLPSTNAPQTPQMSGPRKSSQWPVFK